MVLEGDDCARRRGQPGGRELVGPSGKRPLRRVPGGAASKHVDRQRRPGDHHGCDRDGRDRNRCDPTVQPFALIVAASGEAIAHPARQGGHASTEAWCPGKRFAAGVSRPSPPAVWRQAAGGPGGPGASGRSGRTRRPTGPARVEARSDRSEAAPRERDGWPPSPRPRSLPVAGARRTRLRPEGRAVDGQEADRPKGRKGPVRPAVRASRAESARRCSPIDPASRLRRVRPFPTVSSRFRATVAELSVRGDSLSIELPPVCLN